MLSLHRGVFAERSLRKVIPLRKDKTPLLSSKSEQIYSQQVEFAGAKTSGIHFGPIWQNDIPPVTGVHLCFPGPTPPHVPDTIGLQGLHFHRNGRILVSNDSIPFPRAVVVIYFRGMSNTWNRAQELLQLHLRHITKQHAPQTGILFRKLGKVRFGNFPATQDTGFTKLRRRIIWRLDRINQRGWGHPHCAGDLDKLNNIEAPVAVLIF